MTTRNNNPIVVIVIKNALSIAMLNINMLVISVPVGKVIAFRVGVQLSCLWTACLPIHQNAMISQTVPVPLKSIARRTHATSKEAAADVVKNVPLC